MLESHNEKINALLDDYIARLNNEIKNASPEALSDLGECIVGLYLLKQKMNQDATKGGIELRIMRNLDNMFKDRNDFREI